MTHQGAARQQQVWAGSIEAFVYEEVLLFPAKVRRNLLDGGVEVMTDLCGSHVNSMQGTQQRSLVVERLTAITDKYGGNTQGIVDNEHGRCGIPCGVATSLEGRTDAARGERRGIGLLLNKQLASKLLYHTALAIVLDEGVVLLGRSFRQRLEPVCIVCHSILGSPLLHALSHNIGNLTIKARPIVHHIYHCLIDVLRQILVHLLTVKDLLTKILSGSFTWCFYVERLFLEGLSDNLKS